MEKQDDEHLPYYGNARCEQAHDHCFYSQGAHRAGDQQANEVHERREKPEKFHMVYRAWSRRCARRTLPKAYSKGVQAISMKRVIDT